jgi:thiol-disulfide isomerase/thioredoxin
MKKLIIAAAVAVAIGAAVRAADSRPAPNVTLEAADGSAVRVDAFRGKVVLIDFWASWCVPCKTSFPALDALYREYESRGLQVLAVNLDERRRDADLFLRDRPHTMPSSSTCTARRRRRSASRDAELVRGRSGRTIRFTHMGYSANIGQQYRREIDLLLLGARTTMTRTLIQSAIVAATLTAALAAGGCATVSRGNAADSPTPPWCSTRTAARRPT